MVHAAGLEGTAGRATGAGAAMVLGSEESSSSPEGHMCTRTPPAPITSSALTITSLGPHRPAGRLRAKHRLPLSTQAINLKGTTCTHEHPRPRVTRTCTHDPHRAQADSEQSAINFKSTTCTHKHPHPWATRTCTHDSPHPTTARRQTRSRAPPASLSPGYHMPGPQGQRPACTRPWKR